MELLRDSTPGKNLLGLETLQNCFTLLCAPYNNDCWHCWVRSSKEKILEAVMGDTVVCM